MGYNDIRIYRSAVGGITGAAGHVYIYSPELKEAVGSDFFNTEEHGVSTLNNPYYTLDIGNKSQAKVFKKIKQYPGWSKGNIRPQIIYIPWVYDCYVEAEDALEYAGVPHKIKHKRVDFSKTFTGPSKSRELKQEVDVIIKQLINNNNNKKDKIASIIVNTAKTNHKFKNKTGKLQSSIIYRNDTIYSTSEYADDVANKTNEDFIVSSLEKSKGNISSIITNNNKIDDTNFKEVITNIGHDMLTEQFNRIM